MNKEAFIKEIENLGFKVDEYKLELLNSFYTFMIEWNEKINLTTIIDEENVYLKHYYDSLTIYKGINLNNVDSLCDVGSGAGFPGIILKIFFPKLKITLVDSLNKRVSYLNRLIQKLNLKDIVAIHSRMEDFSKQNEKKFDIITARAVANLEILSEISVRALKINGKLIFMKSNVTEELLLLEKALPKLNLKLNNVLEFNLPIENSKRTLVIIEKIKETPNEYPRGIDKIKRKPLSK